MVEWHHRLNGHGFWWTPGVGDGQGGLECLGPSKVMNFSLAMFIFIIRHLSISTSMSELYQFSSVQFSHSVMSDSLQPHEPHSTPGLPVHHQLLESTQTHVHQVGDAIQPSHPLSSPFPPAPNPFRYHGLFQIGRASCRERVYACV